VVTKSIDDRLQNGFEQVVTVMMEVKTENGAPGCRIVEWSLFSEKIWK
jgi:hypothetical protein